VFIHRGLIFYIFFALAVSSCATKPPILTRSTSMPSSTMIEPAKAVSNDIKIYDLPKNESEDPRKVGSYAFPNAGYEIGFSNNWSVIPIARDALDGAYQKYKEQSPELADFINGYSNIFLAENSEAQYALFAVDSSPERLAKGKTVGLFISQYTDPKRVAVPLDEYVAIFLNDTSSQLDVKNVVQVFSDTGVPIAVIQSNLKQQNSSGQTVYLSYILINTGKAYLEIVVQTFDPSFDVLDYLRLTLRSINYIELAQPSPTPQPAWGQTTVFTLNHLSDGKTEFTDTTNGYRITFPPDWYIVDYSGGTEQDQKNADSVANYMQSSAGALISSSVQKVGSNIVSIAYADNINQGTWNGYAPHVDIFNPTTLNAPFDAEAFVRGLVKRDTGQPNVKVLQAAVYKINDIEMSLLVEVYKEPNNPVFIYAVGVNFPAKNSIIPLSMYYYSEKEKNNVLDYFQPIIDSIELVK